MKRIVSLLLTVASLLCLSIKCYAEEEFIPPEVKAYVVVEPSTGQILEAYNADLKLPVASVTKIMLLLIIAEEIKAGKLSFSDEVPVSAYASKMDGSVIWLEPGEIMSAGDMIKAVVISSANDACVALAEKLSGSEEEFVKRMNKKATALGMKNTHFTNAVGYDDENHYSTASDVAVMVGELFKYDFYNEFMLTRLSSVRTGTDRETQLLNTNKLANYYKGMLGGKTGTTEKAGYCLAACAERNDMRIISVVLGAKNEEARTNMSEYLLDKGYREWQIIVPEINTENLLPIKVEKGLAKTIELELEKAPKCLIPRNAGKKIEYVYNLPESVVAPVAVGQIIGEVKAVLNGDVIFSSNIIAKTETEELNFYKSFEILFRKYFGVIY